MKSIVVKFMFLVMLSICGFVHADSITLYDPEKITLSETKAIKLGFKPYIRLGAKFDSEITMSVNFPNEIDGTAFKNATVRLFKNELSITTHTVVNGQDESGKRQVYVNLNRAVVSKVKLFFIYGYKKYVVTYELNSI